MKEIQVVHYNDDIKTELSSLGLNGEYLIEAVKRGYISRNNVTKNDPPATAGNFAFSTTVRTLRELLLPEGWERIDKHNLCFTSNAETKLAIVVSSGNKDVGIENGRPQTKNPKGEQYKHIISANQDLFGIELKPPLNISFLPNFQTLVLMYYFDLKKREIRLELSSPIDMNNKGYVNSWHKRIIFEPIPFDVEPVLILKPTFDELSDFDIPVKRRQK